MREEISFRRRSPLSAISCSEQHTKAQGFVRREIHLVYIICWSSSYSKWCHWLPLRDVDQGCSIYTTLFSTAVRIFDCLRDEGDFVLSSLQRIFNPFVFIAQHNLDSVICRKKCA